METSIAIFVSGCEHDSCPLTASLSCIPGVSQAVDIDKWDPAISSNRGLFIVAGAMGCSPDPSLVTWYKRYIGLTAKMLISRTWPILVISPHISRWIQDLYAKIGVNLHLEYDLNLIELHHTTYGGRGIICTIDEIQTRVREAVQKILLSYSGKDIYTGEKVGAFINLKQAYSVLEFHAERLHDSIHETRKHGAQIPATVPNPSGELALTAQHLEYFLTKESVKSFKNIGQSLIAAANSQPTDSRDLVAEYFEEAAALLFCQTNALRRGGSPRINVLVVDDDQGFSQQLARSISQPNVIEGKFIPLPHTNIGKIVRRVHNCGGDASLEIGTAIYHCLVAELERTKAFDFWLSDNTQVILVVDIRLDPRAPQAGIEIIRRMRDNYPFVIPVAVTVKRRLAFELADEGAAGYIIKSERSEETIQSTLGMLNSLLIKRGKYHLAPGSEDIMNDPCLRELLETKYFLSRTDNAQDDNLYVAFCSLNNINTVSANICERAVIVPVIPSDYDLGVSQILHHNYSGASDRKVIFLKRLPSSSQGHIICPSSILSLDRSLSPIAPARFNTRWTLLIPKTATYGDLDVKIKDECLSSYRKITSDRFGGATTADARGVWLRPQDNFEIKDDLERIEVLGRFTRSGRQALLNLARRVVTELRQDEVFLQEQPVSNWSLRPASTPILPDSILSPENLVKIEFSVLKSLTA
jgi:hypothetical protein